MAKLLIVEHDPPAARELGAYLSQHGHEVVALGTAREGIDHARSAGPDLLVISMRLPDQSGTEMCREIRADPSLRTVPIIMLGQGDDEIDRIVGFEVGVDDFLSKPYSKRELVLRIRAVLRRQPRYALPDTVMSTGPLRLDPVAHQATVDGADVVLSALEFKLLATLFQRRNQVQSRPSLLENVWGGSAQASERTVDACVKRLRSKLGIAATYIQTVRGVGYRFMAHD